MPQEFVKDANAVLDYEINWSTWLGTDTIATSTWTLTGESGITIGNGANGAPAPTNTTIKATVWLIGGVAGIGHLVTNRIVTAGGRTDERSLKIIVVQL